MENRLANGLVIYLIVPKLRCNLLKELVIFCSVAVEYSCGFLPVKVVPFPHAPQQADDKQEWNNFYLRNSTAIF
ncbi:hypothetical protein [Clostridium saccharobutylicum]|uniref:hypothetical protein n=1 Tax=Clostridium saccharobutylicum TaxID=169679 RepID=UPI00111EB78E|nr:hypothetical protein [Clostridium saccharobutylicum]MBA2903492.1 hypothetical protein [Clostridium saccharobutylicum]MBA8788309.1 hypothetical protein [Clostridium saccharobutylicum]MBA8894988.1 hypothetical protein [Clostridium saccharobutylicum]MBA8984103.1 hypothetical protein [Clostridium saccharobutylicum]MBA8992297.1 hypothetical protein [Clostridium saccharobutylicum]